MPNRIPFLVSVTVLGMAFGVLAIPAPSAASAGPTQILVPAYFYPTTSNDWNRMDAAARQVSLTAILNPNSGPGTSADPNYVTATNKLLASGGSVVGYVSTSYGSRSLASVEADIATYIRLYKVSGFFVDEMSNSASEVAYYAALYSYIKNLNPAYQVIGNPGTSVPEVYLTTPTADTLVTFEGTAASYATATPPAYTSNYPPSRFANIVYGEPTATGMLNDLSLAASRNVGTIYVTDNSNASNPYSALPNYWDQEVAAISTASAVPEPTSMTMIALGLAALAVNGPFRRALGRILPGVRWGR